MTENTHPPRLQIHSVFPSNKNCLVVEDCTHLTDPKLRMAIIPANGENKPPADFFIDLPVARALFTCLLTGSLSPAAASHNKNHSPADGFDLYATMKNGYRSLVIKNKPNGIGILISKINTAETTGTKAIQVVYLTSFQTITLALIVTDYIKNIYYHATILDAAEIITG